MGGIVWKADRCSKPEISLPLLGPDTRALGETGLRGDPKAKGPAPGVPGTGDRREGSRERGRHHRGGCKAWMKKKKKGPRREEDWIGWVGMMGWDDGIGCTWTKQRTAGLCYRRCVERSGDAFVCCCCCVIVFATAAEAV